MSSPRIDPEANAVRQIERRDHRAGSAPVMVAGSSQLVLFGHLDHGTAASLRRWRRSRSTPDSSSTAPRWPTGSADNPGGSAGSARTFAMVLADVDANESNDQFRRYFAAAGTLLWFAWTCSVGVGLLAGPIVPSEVPLDMVLSATFVALIMPGLTRRSEILAVLVGAGVAAGAVGSTGSLGIGALAGAVIGAMQRPERAS